MMFTYTKFEELRGLDKP